MFKVLATSRVSQSDFKVICFSLVLREIKRLLRWGEEGCYRTTCYSFGVLEIDTQKGAMAFLRRLIQHLLVRRRKIVKYVERSHDILASNWNEILANFGDYLVLWPARKELDP